MGHAAEDDPQIRRLFGETRGDEGGRAGRLFFHPTFFDTTGLEVINPHDRVRRVGKNPILFESVPRDTAGTFTLLYVPFDLLGTERNPNAQAGDDLPLIAAGIRAMFRGHGFSAKRTSGFGVAKESVEEGFIEMRVEESVPVEMANPASKGPAQPLAKYLVAPGRLKAEYLNSDGTFRERGQAELTSKTARQEYEKAKKWWEREGKALAAESQLQTQPPPIELPPQKRWLRREFRSFDELVRTAEEIGSQLGKNESERS
jgi:CRISPR-associated protein Cmr2